MLRTGIYSPRIVLFILVFKCSDYLTTQCITSGYLEFAYQYSLCSFHTCNGINVDLRFSILWISTSRVNLSYQLLDYSSSVLLLRFNDSIRALNCSFKDLSLSTISLSSH